MKVISHLFLLAHTTFSKPAFPKSKMSCPITPDKKISGKKESIQEKQNTPTHYQCSFTRQENFTVRESVKHKKNIECVDMATHHVIYIVCSYKL